MAGAHGVAVVFDDVDDGEAPECGEIEGLVEGTLVDGTIAEVAESGAFEFFEFDTVGETEAEGGLAGDDPVATPVVFGGFEIVHRTALPFRAAGGFSEEFGHALVHTHADGESVGVVAIGGDDVVVFAEERDGADGDGFLTDVEVEEAGHFAALVVLERNLFESPDAAHQSVEADFVIGGE